MHTRTASRRRYFRIGAGSVRTEVGQWPLAHERRHRIFCAKVKRKLIFCHYWGRRVSGRALETGTIDYEHRVRSEETGAGFV